MKLQITLLTSALLLALPVLAKEVPLNQAAAIAGSVTPAAASPAFDDLEGQALAQLRAALKGDAATLTRGQLAHAKQNKTQADKAWLKASGYDFQRKRISRRVSRCWRLQQAPDSVVKDNLADRD
jgi:hypothetical protein